MSLEKVLLIYNRESGSNNIEHLLPRLLIAYQEEEAFLVPYCLNIGGSEALLELLEEQLFTKLLISGGDGSINSILSMILRNNIKIPVGLLPSGTCNDLSNSLGLSKKILEAGLVPLKNKVLAVDIGCINDEKYFFSSLAGGYFIDLAYTTNTLAKKGLKQFSYYLKGALKLWRVKPFPITFTVDGVEYNENCILFAFSAGSQIGGFKNILYNASLVDGKLDFFVIKKCSLFKLTTILFRIMTGDFTDHKYVSYFQGESFTVDGPENLLLVHDGELGKSLPLKVDILKKKIDLFIP